MKGLRAIKKVCSSLEIEYILFYEYYFLIYVENKVNLFTALYLGRNLGLS